MYLFIENTLYICVCARVCEVNMKTLLTINFWTVNLNYVTSFSL